jgi:hypothetical protein
VSCYQRFEVLALSHSASFDHRWLPEAWRTAMAIFAAVAYREGWEEVLFLLMFLAIWRLATIEPAGDFQPPLSADLVGHKEHAEYASCARGKRCGNHRDAVFGLRSFATECGAVAASGTIYRALRAFELISFGASGGILHCGKVGQVPGKKPS